MTATETTTVFDTLTAANNLQQAGFNRQQAEALTRAIASAQGNLATKEDIRSMGSRIDALESRIEALHTEIKNGMKIVYYLMLPMQLATLASVIVLATGTFKGVGVV